MIQSDESGFSVYVLFGDTEPLFKVDLSDGERTISGYFVEDGLFDFKYFDVNDNEQCLEMWVNPSVSETDVGCNEILNTHDEITIKNHCRIL